MGFAGLGAMGSGIVRRLLDAGYDVVGWNRTRERAEPLIAAGMGWADTPRELAESVEVMFTMLTDTAAVEATAAGSDGVLAGLGEGVVWADISTISPEASVALAERVRATGASFLDCPVSGSPATLAAGQMSEMAGGYRAAFDRIEAILRAIGPKVTYIGPERPGDPDEDRDQPRAHRLRDRVRGGRRADREGGRGPRGGRRAVLKSVIASPVIGYRAPLLVDDTDVFADVELQQKDLVLAAGACPAARRCGSDLRSGLGDAERGAQLQERRSRLRRERSRGLPSNGRAGVMAQPYRTTIDEVPLEPGLREDEGWIDMQVQFLIDGRTAGSDTLVVGRTLLPPGARHERHRHPNCNEFLVVMSGSGEIYTDERTEPSRGRRRGLHRRPATGTGSTTPPTRTCC